MTTKLLYLFTRTPLHVGAGASVGAIDQPIQRERHTGFPIIPASSLKGSFADEWPGERITFHKEETDGKQTKILDRIHPGAWLFGSDTTDLAFAGALIFSEARVIAFPIRSARGSYAWITCPLMLQRANRDGVFTGGAATEINALNEPADSKTEAIAIFQPDPLGLGTDKNQVILEEHCFTRDQQAFPTQLAAAIAKLVTDDLFASVTDRLVILSNGMMSHFVTTTCEVAQHVRISDETGTAAGTGLFNQENVPADTLFYSTLSGTPSRVPSGEFKDKPAHDALAEFTKMLSEQRVFQFGGDATTGLGFCSVTTTETQA